MDIIGHMVTRTLTTLSLVLLMLLLFSSRFYAGALFANLALTTNGMAAVLAALGRFPAMLTIGARWSGKVKPVFPRGVTS
jgi:hypothetical protein